MHPRRKLSDVRNLAEVVNLFCHCGGASYRNRGLPGKTRVFRRPRSPSRRPERHPFLRPLVLTPTDRLAKNQPTGWSNTEEPPNEHDARGTAEKRFAHGSRDRWNPSGTAPALAARGRADRRAAGFGRRADESL